MISRFNRVQHFDPRDSSLPGSSDNGILQVRILVAMPSSRGSSKPGIKPGFPELQAVSLPSEPPGKLPHAINYLHCQWPRRFFTSELACFQEMLEDEGKG